ncbi:uncharacterized protein LOC144431197 [Styela clava]
MALCYKYWVIFISTSYLILLAKACQGGARKKRDVAPDVNAELSDFFTECLKPIASSFFSSTRSVVDYSIRDCLWYSEVELSLCNGTNNIHECWIGSLVFLINTTSVLYEETAQCICAWADDCDDRKRRAACPNAAAGQLSTIQEQTYLPTELEIAISECIDSKFEPEDMAAYASLQNINSQSNTIFLREHYSYCKPTVITNNNFDFNNVDGFINNFLESLCPTTGVGSLWRHDLQKTLPMVTSVTSPSYQPYTTCTNELNNVGTRAFVGKGPCFDLFQTCMTSKCRYPRMFYDNCRKTCGACSR